MNTISVSDLAARGTESVCRVDVRSTTEFAIGHVPGAINIPLDEIENRTVDLSTNRPLVLICQMGQRAGMAAALLRACRTDLYVLRGGTKAWKDAGLPLVASVKTRWSLERQVQFAAGMLLLSSSVLAAIGSLYWLILTAFVGTGLTFAGITDVCPMAMFLVRLPWNTASHCRVDVKNLAHRPST